MNKMKFGFATILASTAMLAITACGDDVTKVTEIHQDGIAVLEKGKKLSKQACDTTNVGEMLFVTDSSEAFICDGESWQTLKGEKGENGKDGADGKDGAKGDPGKQGEDGKAGANGVSCSAKSVKNKAGLEGLEVTCGETVVDTIWNGEKGEPGEPGKLGEPGKDGKDLIASPGTLGSFVDNRDGHVYKTVVIGTQTWMAENLNYTVNASGQNWCGGGSGKSEGDCDKYGRLYTWATAVGVCPEDWHLPDTTEWKKLFNVVGKTDIVGQKLKANTDLWKSSDGISNDDAFGFSILPAGGRSDAGLFGSEGSYAGFWSSSEFEDDSGDAWGLFFDYNLNGMRQNNETKLFAYSVRCVKD